MDRPNLHIPNVSSVFQNVYAYFEEIYTCNYSSFQTSSQLSL